jgi:hypothetical protein
MTKRAHKISLSVLRIFFPIPFTFVVKSPEVFVLIDCFSIIFSAFPGASEKSIAYVL